MIRFLDRADVEALGGTDVAAALADVKVVLALLRGGDAEMPPETSVPLGQDEPAARAYALPARVGGAYDAAGVKWTAHRPARADGLPRIVSTTLVSEAASGLPLGLVESAILTALRTAAVSALALQTVAPAPLRRVAVLGAGVQARTHLRMLAALFPGLAEVALWNRTPARAAALAREHSWPWRLAAHDDPASAMDGSDAVIACTDAQAPFLGPDAVRPGRILLQVGRHEASFDAIDRADSVVVDLWGEFRLTSAKSLFQMHRAGRFPAERVAADLAQAALDGWRPAPGSAVYVSSFGLNIFDIALAARLLRAAAAAGRGRLLDLFPGGRPC